MQIDTDLVALMTPEEIADTEKKSREFWENMVKHGPGTPVTLYLTSHAAREFCDRFTDFTAAVRCLHDVHIEPLIKGVTIISKAQGEV